MLAPTGSGPVLCWTLGAGRHTVEVDRLAAAAAAPLPTAAGHHARLRRPSDGSSDARASFGVLLASAAPALALAANKRLSRRSHGRSTARARPKWKPTAEQLEAKKDAPTMGMTRWNRKYVVYAQRAERERQIHRLQKEEGIDAQEAARRVGMYKPYWSIGGWDGKWNMDWKDKVSWYKDRRGRRGQDGPEDIEDGEGPDGDRFAMTPRQKLEKREFRMDKLRPPPADTGTQPTGGAWRDGRPESEDQRQGLYKSPWTGQVYDRWAPINLKQEGTDRQGGLGRQRAFETPGQRKVREAQDVKETQEIDMYYPGMAPYFLKEEQQEGKGQKVILRYAYMAGSFKDVFKQICVQAVLDLKVSKNDKPVWYVETCGGEGEYHVNRLRKPEEQKIRPWPDMETIHAAFKDKYMSDTGSLPMEIRGFMDAMRCLNEESDDFEVNVDGKAADAEEASKGGVQWLTSTLHVALQILRPQDLVTVFEDEPVPFASMCNFVKNFGDRFASHVELVFKNGMKTVDYRYFQRKEKSQSKAHGPFAGQKGVILMDPEWVRASEQYWCHRIITQGWKHWRAATVIMFYPLSPKSEHKARAFNRKLVQQDPTLDLLSAELYVNNRYWTEEIGETTGRIPRWRGIGCLISQPPHTSKERIRTALMALCQEMCKQPGAVEMRVTVEKVTR